MSAFEKKSLLTGAMLCLALSSCADWEMSWFRSRQKPDAQVAAPDSPLTDSVSFRDTVAEVAWVEGLRHMRVQGYGVVAGLGNRGSRDCPREVRKLLLQEMYKMPEFHRGQLAVTPERIIDDTDTAVVIVEGDIPPAAVKGAPFDLTVRALPGTQTVSLEGGRLYTCDLRLLNEGRDGGVVAGQVLASGAGPVFINPWATSQEAATAADPRLGYVLGGGRVAKDRRVRLVLEQASYRMASAVADRINARFTQREKVADAQSPSHVRLRIPAEYTERPAHFLALVRHLYLPTLPGFLDQRAQELSKELSSPDAPHEDIALAFEGIGRSSLPLLRNLYSDGRDHVSFHAALTGIRLGDDLAIEPIAQHALSARGAYRSRAIEALAWAQDMSRAALALRRLVDDDDPRVRVAAYEGLRRHTDPSIKSRRVGGDNFVLDVVESTGGHLIYARRRGERRIALFGSTIDCSPPLFYSDADGAITLNAEPGDTHVTLVRKVSFPGRVSPAIPARPGLPDLLPMLGDDPKTDAKGQVHGLAVQYSLVVKALADLCRMGAINAKFMLEQETVSELFGPLKEPGRRESEL